jgi:DNA gyrase inhibitor GyrI
MPLYEIIEKKQAYEIRHYEEYIVAETRREGRPAEAMSGGFNELFRYISGENISQSKIRMTAPVLGFAEEQGQKIAMTAPVLADGRKESSSIAFIMPPESTWETLPVPKSPDVNLKRVPSHKVAVISFSGYATAEALEEKTAELLQALHADGIPLKSNPRIALYDPPWTPPNTRRNEIMVEVD